MKQVTATIDYPTGLLFKPHFPFQTVADERYDRIVPIVAKWLRKWSVNSKFVQYGTIDNAIIRPNDGSSVEPSNIDMDWYNGCMKTIVTSASRGELLPFLHHYSNIGLDANRGRPIEFDENFSYYMGVVVSGYQHYDVLAMAYQSRINNLVETKKLTKLNVIKCLTEDAPNPPTTLVSRIVEEKAWPQIIRGKYTDEVLNWAGCMTKDSPTSKLIYKQYLGTTSNSQRACYTRWIYIFQKEVTDKIKYRSIDDCLRITNYVQDFDRRMFISIQKENYTERPHLVYMFLARNAPWFNKEFVLRLEVGIINTINNLISRLPPITKPFYVYRGMSDDDSYLTNHKGDLISTSVMAKWPIRYSNDMTVARIKLSKGVRALPIMGIICNGEQTEIALSSATKYTKSNVVGKRFCDSATSNSSISHSMCVTKFRRLSEWKATPTE